MSSYHLKLIYTSYFLKKVHWYLLSLLKIHSIYFTAIGIPAFLLVLQVYMGHDASWSIAIFTIALTVNGAVTAGHLGNGLDIAPNFSGILTYLQFF